MDVATATIILNVATTVSCTDADSKLTLIGNIPIVSKSKSAKSQMPQDAPQPLVGFMTNEEWNELLAHVDGLVQEMDELPFPEVKKQVFELLAGIDTIHREGLRRLVRLFKSGVLEQVVTDPTIHTLMELYGLLPPKANSSDEQASKIQWTTSRAKTEVPAEPDRPNKPKYPHWVPVLKAGEEMSDGAIVKCQIDDRQILLCRVKNEFFAVDSACAQDGSLLADAKLNKYNLVCPHHAGCYYDVRHGGRIASDGGIECFPVKLDESGRMLVGVDMDFEPKLPAF
jgi:nitrite reductase/ring-hydroxylating ferredoxin subunit